MDQCFGTGPNLKSPLGKGVPALEASGQTHIRSFKGRKTVPTFGHSFMLVTIVAELTVTRC